MIVPKGRQATHPGMILLKEFIEPLGLSLLTMMRWLTWSEEKLAEVLKGETNITVEDAYLLSDIFGTDLEFWLILQLNYNNSKQ